MERRAVFSLIVVISCYAVGAAARNARTGTPSDPRLRLAQQEIEEGNKLYDADQIVAAAPHVERALTLREAALGPDHPLVAECLSLLGRLEKSQSHFSRAESLLKRALRLQERSLGSYHPDTATSLNRLGILYLDQDDLVRAQPLLERALKIREATLGPLHSDVAQSLTNMGHWHFAAADYPSAEAHYVRALQIRETNFGPNHQEVVSSLNHLSVTYIRQGLYRQAELRSERALQIQEKLDPNHPNVAIALDHLAGLYVLEGAYARAEPLYQRALKMLESSLGLDASLVAMPLHDLAILYLETGDYARAEPLILRALKLRETTLGSQNALVAQSLIVLAILYKLQGTPDRARPLLERAAQILEANGGADGPALALVLDHLAGLYLVQGDYAQAEPLFQRALRLRETTHGTSHPEIVDSLDHLAQLRLAQHRDGEALVYLERAFAISENSLRKDVPYFSESRLAEFLDRLRGEEELVYALLRSSPSDVAVRRLALVSILLRKGRSGLETADIYRSVYRSLDAATREKFEHLRDLRSQIAALSLEGPKSHARPGEEPRLRALETEADTVEADLARRSAPLRELTTLPGPAHIVDRVAAALPKDGALIEIVASEDRPIVSPLNTSANRSAYPRRYLALILLPDGSSQAVDLGPAAPIDIAIASLRIALGKPDVAYQPAAEALYHLVVQPIALALGPQRRLFISPDGQLNLVPFGALHDGTRFLEDAFTWVYLTSGKDLLRRPEPSPQNQSVVVFAAPAFDAMPVLSSPFPGPRTPDMEVSPALRQFFSEHRGGTFRTSWGALSGTREEALAVRRLFPEARLLLDAMASKQALLELPPPSILHIATHGFFDEDDPVPSGSTGRPMAVVDPLLRSGLVLAGANPPTLRHPRALHRIEESFATSLELAAMNLSGTQLVVLSACDTGRGEVKLGQGVYGLRRAFTIAGAETLVTSLWQVDDETTAMLMSDFYRGLRDGQGRAEALRNAMQALRKTHPHPYYWAPFILIGNDAPLRGLTP